MQTEGSKGRMRRGRSQRGARRGAAVVEFAVVTPLLLMMIFGVMEFGWAFMVHETLTNAAREACRVGVLQDSTDDDIQARFAVAIAPTRLTVTPDMLTIEHATADNPVVTVTVTVPYSQVSLTGLTSFLHISRTTIGSVCSMRKEGVITQTPAG